MSDSMRDDLNAALDADAGDFDETPQEVETHESTTEVTETETTSEEPAPTEAASEPSEDPGAEGGEPAPGTEPEPELARSGKELLAGDSIKPPMDWSPKEREDWSKIPRHLQDKVMKREKDMSDIMQNTSDARRTHDQFNQLSQQYGSVLAGVMGDTPMETVSTLFSTVANLRVGSPVQKAQIVADMISQFGVDINTLDSALVGQAPEQGQQQNSEIERMLNERLAPFEQQLGQQNAYAQQQATQRQDAANTEVRDFGQKAEFINDVRHDMADMIEMAASRGQELTMAQAYQKACAINPQILSILQERHDRNQLTGSNNAMAAKRNAASSVSGRQIGGGAGGSGNMSMHDTISAAWDSQ